MSKEQVEKAPLPKRSARNGFIEILQVASLILFGVALLLPEVRGLAVCIALVLFVVPFLLVRSPDRESHRRWARGYKITPESRQKLAEIGVPVAILHGIDASMIGAHYRWRRNFVKALYQNLGQENVQPWLNKILRHTKYYGEPSAPAPSSGANQTNAVTSPAPADLPLRTQSP
jgi:hypothetical protein